MYHFRSYMKFKTFLLSTGLVMSKLRVIYNPQYRYMGLIKINMYVGSADLSKCKKRLKTKFREISPDILFYHCLIHRESLTLKNFNFNKVLQDFIYEINFIKAKTLNNLHFAIKLSHIAI